MGAQEREKVLHHNEVSLELKEIRAAYPYSLAASIKVGKISLSQANRKVYDVENIKWRKVGWMK